MKIYQIIFYFIFSITLCQVNTENMRSDDLNLGFINQLDFDYNYEGTDDVVTEYAVGYRLDYIKSKRVKYFGVINFEQGYEQEKDQDIDIFSNKGFIHLRNTSEFVENYSYELFTQYEFNDFLLLDERFLIGAGLRLTKNGKMTKNYYSMGLMYESESYSTDDESVSLVRSTNYMNNTIFLNDNITFKNVIYFQFAIDNIDDFRVLYDASMDFEVNEFISISMKLNHRYDNDPISGLSKYYTQISNGISIHF
jgi:hypothetical protein